ncbi:MAG: glycosyltransferase [Acidimicrobiia bacterium]
MRPLPRLVSVVMPARNAEATVGAQLAALAGQTYTGGWELVVADNGSTDGTGAVVQAWIGRIPGVRIVDASARRGSAAARNTGVAMSVGEFVAHCEADDVVTPGWLAALVSAAPAYDMVGGPIECGLLNSAEARAWRGLTTAPTPALMRFGDFLSFAVGASCGIWREVLDAVDGWNESCPSQTDVELSWRVQLSGYTLGFAPDALVHYRLRERLGPLVRQSYAEGLSYVRLYHAFRHDGAPRPPARRAVDAWVRIARSVPAARSSRVARGRVLRAAAGRVGRLVGSARYRTVYL